MQEPYRSDLWWKATSGVYFLKQQSTIFPLFDVTSADGCRNLFDFTISTRKAVGDRTESAMCDGVTKLEFRNEVCDFLQKEWCNDEVGSRCTVIASIIAPVPRRADGKGKS